MANSGRVSDLPWPPLQQFFLRGNKFQRPIQPTGFLERPDKALVLALGPRAPDTPPD